MVTTTIKRILPAPIKHPFLTYEGWYWRFRGLPAQSWTDISIFKEVFSQVESQRIKIFEWGSGASTVYYPEFLRIIGRQFDWYAADNSLAWCQRSQEKVAKANLSEQVQIFCSEFPAFWELPGYSYANPVPPESSIDIDRAKEYVDRPKNLGVRFDVMILDGRFRRRCLQIAAEVMAPKGIVILHDAQRAHYHSSLDLFPHVQFLETGVLPGTRTFSNIALASLGGGDLIAELAQKYGNPGQSGNSI